MAAAVPAGAGSPVAHVLQHVHTFSSSTESLVGTALAPRHCSS